MRSPRSRLPLLPLPDTVHFPATELRLTVCGPRYERLIADLEELDEGARWVGLALAREIGEEEADSAAPVFPLGTAARLVAVEPEDDGVLVQVRGELRVRIAREVTRRPYRTVEVEPVAEVAINDQDPGVVAVRTMLVELLAGLAEGALADAPLGAPTLEALLHAESFEGAVNRVAADIDLPAVSKQELLTEPLLERALSLISILRSRQRVFALLDPFRHLASGAPRN